ncbi:MAG: hypothetical protein COA78_04070 [Blastopirellula sp.]|nr:MAG: hypothetical protein COA78_04070 [Blastopirellula sp.]
MNKYCKTQRSHFSKIFVATMLIVGMIRSATLEAENFDVEDQDLIEAFLYSCSHCFDMEPLIVRWQRENTDAKFTRVPVVGGDEADDMLSSWTFAKTYYTFGEMGVLEEMHRNYFTAIHIERRNLNSFSKILEFVSEHELDTNTFQSIYNSESVRQNVLKAREYTTRQGLDETPTFIVRGKEHLLLNMFEGNAARLLINVDFLLRKPESE